MKKKAQTEQKITAPAAVELAEVVKEFNESSGLKETADFINEMFTVYVGSDLFNKESSISRQNQAYAASEVANFLRELHSLVNFETGKLVITGRGIQYEN